MSARHRAVINDLIRVHCSVIEWRNANINSTFTAYADLYYKIMRTHTVDTHTHTNHIRAIFWKGLDLWSETTPGITSPKLKSFHAEMSDLTSTFDNYVTRLCLSLYVSVRRGRWDNLHHIFGAPQPRWASRKETELIEKMQFKPYNTSKGNQSNDDLRAGQCTVSRMKIWL